MKASWILTPVRREPRAASALPRTTRRSASRRGRASRLGGTDGPRHVQMVRQRVVDGVDLRIGEQFLVRPVGLLDAKRGGGCLRPGEIARRDRRDGREVALLHRGNHLPRGDAGDAEDSPSESSHLFFSYQSASSPINRANASAGRSSSDATTRSASKSGTRLTPIALMPARRAASIPDHRVLHDDAALGRNAHRGCCSQEDLRIRLTDRDVFGGDDRIEFGLDAKHPQHHSDVGSRRGRRDGLLPAGGVQGAQPLRGARQRRQPAVLDEPAIFRFLGVTDLANALSGRLFPSQPGRMRSFFCPNVSRNC